LRIAVIAFVTLAVATSGLVSSLQTAAAASMANLWAVPVNSRINDGLPQLLRLLFIAQDASEVDRIKLTMDGTRVIEFDDQGNVMGVPDPAFLFVTGKTKYVLIVGGEYYYYSIFRLVQGKFLIAVDKGELAVGKHTVVAEIFFKGGGPPLTDDAMFNLRAGPSAFPDLVAKNLATPHWIQMGREYHAYFIQKNQGSSKAGEHTLSLYLSSDEELDPGDEMLADMTVEQLFAGRSKMFHMTFELPDDAAKGQAFLIAMTDAGEVLDEGDEGNNIAVKEINVAGGA